MIALILYSEKDKYGHTRQVVSHGVDTNTLRNIVLSQDPIEYYIRECQAFKHPEHGWCIDVEKP